ncbi:sugar ABC transporter substrate-binding protein [Streptomyces sp. NBC_01433]|uniref:substrate-binding domain-containing protein n=1 Tax=Streptomyces sp. NBC_01433 TaxID=2903864 RepID=UPI002253C4E1|nr:substrate-binding domain-containing protein [Streptomyces sp. NBC_01433]MCX4679238.1 sugar ABC transporter substrate-binding protein [Streptomyces sp. NBC_01433]
MRLPTRVVVPGVLAVALLMASSACTVKTSGEPAGDRSRASGRTGGGSAELADGSGTKVALVPGGAHPYFQPWKKAGAAAENAYGLGDVAFDETAEWDQQKQNNLLSTLAARGYNAFGVFGVSPTDINTTFADLKAQGFAVASLGSCPAGGRNEAEFCLSTDVELAAYKAARAAIDAMGGKGTLVHLTGNNVDANTQLRMKGVSKAVSESGGKVTLLQTITDIDKDLQTAQKAVSDLLAAKGSRIQGIVATAYNPAVAAADAVSSAGSTAKVVAIDDDAKILSSIRKSSVTATVVQNPVAQADVGAWALALLRTEQCTVRDPGQIVDSGSFVVTESNVDEYDNDRRAKTAQLKKQFADDILTCG